MYLISKYDNEVMTHLYPFVVRRSDHTNVFSTEQKGFSCAALTCFCNDDCAAVLEKNTGDHGSSAIDCGPVCGVGAVIALSNVALSCENWQILQRA